MSADNIEAGITAALDEIEQALRAAIAKHGSINSAHEGYAVIKEELDELWEEIRADRGHDRSAMEEAAQIGAMAGRFIMDVGGYRKRTVNVIDPETVELCRAALGFYHERTQESFDALTDAADAFGRRVNNVFGPGAAENAARELAQ